VNVSTQIKHVFRDSLSEYFREHLDGYEPVKILAYMRDKVQETVTFFIERFGSRGKA
jgi:fructose/tagatose bisphosphate aldolase